MATALLGSVAALVALALPWWSASGRSATPTANGLFPALTASLVVLAVVGVDVAVRMGRNSGTAPHALVVVAIAVLAVVGITWYALDGWGEATRGYGQVAASVGATLVLAITTLGLTSAATTPPATIPSATTPPATAPTVAAPLPEAPRQSPEAPSTSFWFRVEIAIPLFGPDGVNAVSLLQPGRWYLAVGLAPGWVIAQDGNGVTGYVHEDKIVRGAR